MKVIVLLVTLILANRAVLMRFKGKQTLVQVRYKYKNIKGDEGECPISCDSLIYCRGELLHDIQMARIYPDSKTFVDKSLLHPPSDIVKKYANLKKKYKNLSPQRIKKFVEANFADEDLSNWIPSDYKEAPPILNKIRDETFKEWIIEINKMWLNLAAKTSVNVTQNPQKYSMISLPEGFIKPGGRFREMYYWDTYWIIRGLLLSGMTHTVKGILENMIHLVKLFGFVPKGNRIYYINRSQPPLLIQMAATYHFHSKNDNFLRDNLKYLEQEFQWWYVNRTINVKKNGRTYKMARYNVPACSPRPEAYFEDYLLSMNLTTDDQKRRLFTGITSAAESGWDFSSKHIRNKDGGNKNSVLLDLDGTNLIYVELNALLHSNAIALRQWYKYFGDEHKRIMYDNIANSFLDAIENVLWNEDEGIWLDYDFKLGKSRNYFFASNLAPLWTNSYKKDGFRADKVVKYLKNEGLVKPNLTPTYLGTPVSKVETGYQWDFPNCWAPLQAMVTFGLYRSGNSEAKQIALNLVKSWIRTVYGGFYACKFMYEKYNVIKLGMMGEGGEYESQTGFGWTNGFLMEIFDTWGSQLLFNDVMKNKPKPGFIKCPKL